MYKLEVFIVDFRQCFQPKPGPWPVWFWLSDQIDENRRSNWKPIGWTKKPGGRIGILIGRSPYLDSLTRFLHPLSIWLWWKVIATPLLLEYSHEAYVDS
ncbi:hypothetical protein Hanom_Chr09g00780871 [Helianthus anomalus]